VASRLEQLVAQAQAKIAVPEIVWGFGIRDLGLQKSPPRVVWVPNTDGHFAPDSDSGNPRSIATRRAGFDAHCWGKDHGMAEQLADVIINAFDELCGASLRIGTATWQTQQAQEAGYIKLGEVYVLPLTVDFAVTKRPWDTRRVSDVRFKSENAIQGDGILHSGEE
jgi:hypothetical protein